MSYLFAIRSSSFHSFIVWNLTLDARNTAEYSPRCKITKMELQMGCMWVLKFQDESNFQCIFSEAILLSDLTSGGVI
jgi:hypothetical protein